MRAIVFRKCGGPEVLELREVDEPIVKPHEVLIKVQAATVNRRDLWRREGRYSPPERKNLLGFECSGSVVEVGIMVKGWTKGNQVCAFLPDGGGYAELVAVSAVHVLPIPKGLNVVKSAALPCAAAIIWLGFFSMNKLNCHDKILIHGGAGGVGSLAIQIAKNLGCTVYATEGSDEKVSFCKKLGADFAINYKTEVFSNCVHKTAKTGVDCILDNMGRKFMEQNLETLAIGGKLIIHEHDGVWPRSLVNFKQLAAKGLQVMGLDLYTLSDTKLAIVLQGVQRDVWPMIAKQDFTPGIDNAVFNFNKAPDAHKHFESNKHIGKILLTPLAGK
ncbi:quinone oxidoreductase PIG3-like isoform X2 [Coffea eugenioides]|uniref:Enoyl reductase (ER) domain-containing protein n=2 Tax=Coffea TaxID=13442 RepID=A0ABM4UZ60_COFAR|nr:quinone oxidoreductase PIG3-like isoform X2 [Coffea eugenioides]